MNKECKHTHLKVRKHRGEDSCCLHCLEKDVGQRGVILLEH